jgi:hypothetical protein
MSTKIFDGWRIELRGRTVFEYTQVMRTNIEACHQRRHRELLLSLAYTYADAYLLGEQVVLQAPPDTPALYATGCPLYEAAWTLRVYQRFMKNSGLRAPDYDLSFEMAFLADPSDATVLYALAYHEDPAYRAVIAALPGTSEYEYWNNSDHPPHVTNDMWEQRRQTWDRVLGENAPVARALTWRLRESLQTPVVRNTEGLDAYRPSRRERARVVARRRAIAVMDARRSPRDRVRINADTSAATAMRVLIEESDARAVVEGELTVLLLRALPDLDVVDLWDLREHRLAPRQ